jgi:putative ABC transport system permease protein
MKKDRFGSASFRLKAVLRTFRFWIWLIALIGVIVPRRLRAHWRREWEAELRHREAILADWDRLDLGAKLDLFQRSASAFWDALWLQPKRLEDEMFQDLRFGVRMLVRGRGLTVAAVLCLALGIGANAAIFSLASAVLWRPLPVEQPGQLVEIIRGDGMNGNTLSHPDYMAISERNDTLAGLAISSLIELSFSHSSQSQMITGELVSGNYFDVIGVKPGLGRAFLPEEDRVPGERPVVVVSHDFWQSQLGGDPELVGKTIRINNQRYTVVGVAPSGFRGANTPFAAAVWIPVMMIEATMTVRQTPPPLKDRGHEFAAIGRLKPGVSLVQAQAQLEAFNRQLELANPLPADRTRGPNADRSLKLVHSQGLFAPLRPMANTATALLSAVVGLVLLIACANVANLLLARAAARRKEIAIRLALGAGRMRLIRQLLTESFLLALLGAVVGLLIAIWINQALMALEPPVPAAWNFQIDLRLDAAALGFTILLTFVTALIFGLAPALQASKPDLVPALKDEASAPARRGRYLRWLSLRNSLVVAQLAVSLVLLVGAGLFIRSLQHVQRLDLGFKTEDRLAMSFNLAMQGYDEARTREFVARAIERLAALPGVERVSAANTLPLGVMGFGAPVEIEGRPTPPDARPVFVENQLVGLDYLRTMGTRLVHGRDFTAQDATAAVRVAIINERMARRFFPNEDPLGKRLRMGEPNAPFCEIVGVAQDVTFNLGADPGPAVYRPLAQQSSQWLTLVVHTTGDPKAQIAAVRRAVQAIDDNLPAQEIKTLEEIVGLQFWPARMLAGLLAVLGSVGLLLASVGVYGVMSYVVAQRTREIGVRMALGAQSRDVIKLIVSQGVGLTLAGAAIGLALAFASTRLIASLLYGIEATDPVTFILVPSFLLGVAVVSCYLPARRGTKVDPILALRSE